MVPAEVSGVAVTDADVRARFDASKDRYAFPERRVAELPPARPAEAAAARHGHGGGGARLLRRAPGRVQAGRSRSARATSWSRSKATPEATEGHADDEARKIAQSALDQAKAGADFAALAQEGVRGPGLGAAGRRARLLRARAHGAGVRERRLLARRPAQTSDLVKTQYGYHVIRVDVAPRRRRRPPSPRCSDRINKTLMGQRVRTLLEEQMQGISEALRHGKSIEDVAKERGFTVDRSAPLARGADTPPLDSPALVARAFELKRGETEPEPFPLPTGYAFISVQEVQAAAPRRLQGGPGPRQGRPAAGEGARGRAARRRPTSRRGRRARGLEKAAAAPGARAQGDAGPRLARPAHGRPRHERRPRRGGLRPAEPSVLSDPIRVPGGWAVVRVAREEGRSIPPPSRRRRPRSSLPCARSAARSSSAPSCRRRASA